MPVDIVLGAAWGDEGKGKLVNVLGDKAQVCARAQGGHNAGHSIVANGVSYDFHLLPSGLVNSNCTAFIGTGVVVHVPTFFSELKKVTDQGLDKPGERLYISDRCHIDFDLHIAVDQAQETELGSASIGTTKRGIGPCYASMATRSGITIAQMFDEPTFEKRLRKLAEGYQKRYGDALVYNVDDEIAKFKEHREKLRPFVVDGVVFMANAQKSGARILVEGSQALMLDLNYGTYPWVTSSNTGLGGIITGLGLHPKYIGEVVGVVKAYTSRVGGGPFPTEDLGEAGTKLQEIGREWGVSTGRRRRCGWLDLVQVGYSALVNAYTSINLTKLDILDSFDTIKVCVAYRDPQTGQDLPAFPADLTVLDRVEVVWKEMPGWKQSTSGLTSFDQLPKAAQDYVLAIEENVGVRVRWIGTGPGKEEMIDRGEQ